ncbi:hypothetical protein D3C85_1444680 [compost metagenome]
MLNMLVSSLKKPKRAFRHSVLSNRRNNAKRLRQMVRKRLHVVSVNLVRLRVVMKTAIVNRVLINQPLKHSVRLAKNNASLRFQTLTL